MSMARTTTASFVPSSNEWRADWRLTPASQTDAVEVVIKRRRLITLPMMQTIFPIGEDFKLKGIADELNSDLELYHLNTKLRLTHFFAQVREEVGPAARTVENFNYSSAALKGLFSYFRQHGSEADQFGRSDTHPADPSAIANRAYANRNGNGDIASGDGWRYQGRGLKQLTGRGNYQDFQRQYGAYWRDAPDFMRNPDLLAQPKYAARSAVFFWLRHALHAIADRGEAGVNVDAITKIVNKHTDSYDARREHFASIWSKGIFDGFSNE